MGGAGPRMSIASSRRRHWPVSRDVAERPVRSSAADKGAPSWRALAIRTRSQSVNVAGKWNCGQSSIFPFSRIARPSVYCPRSPDTSTMARNPLSLSPGILK